MAKLTWAKPVPYYILKKLGNSFIKIKELPDDGGRIKVKYFKKNPKKRRGWNKKESKRRFGTAIVPKKLLKTS